MKSKSVALFSLFLAFLNLSTCSDLSNVQEDSSQVKQAALACIVTGPGAPVCAAVVTGGQILISVLVGGAVVATATAAYSLSDVRLTIKKVYNVVVRPQPKVTPKPCTCTFSNSISASATGDTLMMACGIAVRKAGVAACAAAKGPGGSKAKSLKLIGDSACKSIFGNSYSIGC